MNMKFYEKPELEVIEFKSEDIIATSGGGEEGMESKGTLTGSGWSKIFIGNSNRPGGFFG